MGRRRNPLAEVFFLGIPTLLFVFVMLIPLMMSVFYSFTDWDGISKSYGFVGAENYVRIFTTDTDFLDAFLFTAAMSAVTTVLTVLLGIILAAALSGGMRGRNILRLAFFLPNTLGGVVLGYVWKFILLIGVPYLGSRVSWQIFQIAWLGTPWSAFIAIALVSIWQGAGYVMVIMIAAFVGVPYDLTESAILDGASARKILFSIKLPYCMPYITVCVFWVLSQTFKMFDLNVALTNGGPYGSTVSMALQIYRDAFNLNKYSLANAEAVIFFLILFVLTGIQMKVSKDKEEKYDAS